MDMPHEDIRAYLISHNEHSFRQTGERPTILTSELSQKSDCVLGRDKQCAVILNDPRISRRHAIIRWQDDHFRLEDQGSQNGSYLNGIKIKHEILRDGDIVKIGKFEFLFRLLAKGEIKKLVMLDNLQRRGDQTIVDHMADITQRLKPSQSGFAGDFSSLAMDEIIQVINQSKKNGLLTVKSQDLKPEEARLYFKDGEVVHASQGKTSGADTLLQVLQVSRGTFEFLNDLTTTERSVEESTIWMLFEAARLKDEKLRPPDQT